MEYPYKEIQYGNENEQNIDTFNIMDDFQKSDKRSQIQKKAYTTRFFLNTITNRQNYLMTSLETVSSD